MALGLRGLFAATGLSVGSTAIFPGLSTAATVNMPVLPAQFQAAIQSGFYRQVGALITNPSTGKIVPHLQQTGAARDLTLSLIQNGSGILSSLASPLSLVGTVATFAQNRAILQGIETIRLLQMGGLAMTGLDIGIGLASFAITQARLKEVSRGLAEVKDQLSHLAARIEDLCDETIRADLLALEGVCRQADDAWSLADPVPAWSATVEPLYRLEVTFFDRAQRLLAKDGAKSLAAVERFLEAALLASATLVSVRTACRDLDAGRKAADRSAAALHSVTNGIGLKQALMSAIAVEGKLTVAGRVDAMERHQPQAAAQVKRLRLREEQASSGGLALQRLIGAGVDGRAYLERMRSEKDAAFALVLPETDLATA